MPNGGYANGPDSSRTVREAPFTLREWFVWRRLRWHLALLAVAILFLGYLGPFGTYVRMPLGERMAYWALAVAGNWSLALACILPAVAWLSGRVPVIVCVLGGGLVASLPGTLLIVAIQLLFAGAVPESVETGELFLSNALIHMVLGLIVWRTIELPMRRAGGAPYSEPPGAKWPDGDPDGGTAAAPILDRLPVARRGRLLHLQVRDHYVEIHTDRGSELVLMRFGDALKELGGTEGMQVHRSHWIARAAVKKIVRRAGRTAAFLENGAEVPVSRRYARALRDANWV